MPVHVGVPVQETVAPLIAARVTESVTVPVIVPSLTSAAGWLVVPDPTTTGEMVCVTNPSR